MACDAWKDDTSLVDLFGAIDSFDRKKRLLAGEVSNRTISAVNTMSPTDEDRSLSCSSVSNSDNSEYEDENIGAVAGGRYAGKEKYTKEQREEYRRKNKDKYRKEGSGDRDRYRKSSHPGKPEREYKTKNENWKKVEDITQAPTIPIVSLAAPESGSLAQKLADTQKMMKLMEEKMEKMEDRMNKRGPYVPIEERMCFRCQGKGHRSHECTAPKPVPRISYIEGN